MRLEPRRGLHGLLRGEEAEGTAEQVLPEGRGAREVWFSGSQKTEFLEEWNVKYCVKEGWKEHQEEVRA